MILEWLIGLAGGFVEWIASLFPELEIPEALANLDESFNAIFSMGEGLGAFVPWGLVLALCAIPLAVWAAGLLIRAARAMFAHLPYIGGRG